MICNKKIYIIGDVHGCYKTLLALIDKGNNSKDVIEFVKSNKYFCGLGNHEKYRIDSLPLILEDMGN